MTNQFCNSRNINTLLLPTLLFLLAIVAFVTTASTPSDKHQWKFPVIILGIGSLIVSITCFVCQKATANNEDELELILPQHIQALAQPHQGQANPGAANPQPGFTGIRFPN